MATGIVLQSQDFLPIVQRRKKFRKTDKASLPSDNFWTRWKCLTRSSCIVRKMSSRRKIDYWRKTETLINPLSSDSEAIREACLLHWIQCRSTEIETIKDPSREATWFLPIGLFIAYLKILERWPLVPRITQLLYEFVPFAIEHNGNSICREGRLHGLIGFTSAQWNWCLVSPLCIFNPSLNFQRILVEIKIKQLFF